MDENPSGCPWCEELRERIAELERELASAGISASECSIAEMKTRARAEQAERERNEARAALAELARSIRMFAEKSQGIMALAYAHGMEYDGPTCEAALAVADRVLAAPGSGKRTKAGGGE